MALCATLPLAAQSDPILDRLTVEDGLSQGYISCITQDREGFLWIGTRNGLNRYDGREFRVFFNDPLDPYSISGNIPLSIADWGDYLLVGTLGNGLNVFDKKTQRFYRLRSKQGLPEGNYAEIKVDQHNRVWCRVSLRNGQRILLRLVLAGQPVQTDTPYWEATEVQIWEFGQLEIRSICQTEAFIWGIDGGKLFQIDKNTGSVRKLDMKAPLNSAFVAGDGSVWFYGDTGIGKLNGTRQTWWDTDFFINHALYDEQKGSLLIIRARDVLQFDASTLKTASLQVSDGQRLLSSDFGVILTVFCDASGIIWTGTNGYGLLKHSPRLHRFKTYFKGKSVYRPVLTDAQNAVGVLLRSERKILDVPDTGPMQLPAQPVIFSRIAIDGNGNQWMVMERNDRDLELYKRPANPSAAWEPALKYACGPATNFTLDIDTGNNIWIAVKQQLIKYDPAKKEMKSFDFSGVLDGKYNVKALAGTSGGFWWIGTDKGLVQAIPWKDGFRFALLRTIPEEHRNIQNNNINALMADPVDPAVLWIGTLGGGLSRLDTRNMQFRHYNIRNGFPDNVIYGILTDENHTLWMSSNRGIICLEPATGTVKNFTVKDGLPTNEFNVWAYARRVDGTMLFGCVEGLVAFHPRDFIDNPFAPGISITGLEVNNRRIAVGDSSGLLQQSIEFTRRLKLPASGNSITIYFAALEYTIPSKNGFRYYLKGAEPEWTHSTTDNKASYLNLAPGSYTFLVRACNSDGVWNETPAALEITILPPWYRSKWAYAAYALLLLSLAYGVLRFYLHRQRLHDKLAFEQREAERLKELDTFKSKFYTNISHELRTPLTLIVAPLEQHIRQYREMLDRKSMSNLDMVLRNSRKLLRLIEELLDLSKLDASKLSLNEHPLPLVQWVRQWHSAYKPMAEIKQVDYRLTSSIDDKALFWLDRNLLEKIVDNLMSNALKFTSTNGTVELSLERIDGMISLQVRDTGRGIPEEDLPHVFERYFQTSRRNGSEEGGLGIGLALSWELALLMNGKLTVESRPGAGSVFTLLLPAREALDSGPEPVLRPPAAEPAEETTIIADTENTGNADKHGKLLIVEDTPDMQQFLLGLLQENYECICANNGREAWEMLNIAKTDTPDFDLIISDIMMPEMDGYALLKRIKEHPRWQYCPVIMLTARAAGEDKLRALRLGVDDYLTKPFSSAELLARVANLIQNRRRRDALPTPSKGVTFDESDLADQQWLAEMEAIVKQALDKKIEIKTLYLAEKAAMSDRQLLRRLKALTGLSINEYIQEVKLQKARHLLETRAFHTIAEVAYACNFNTPAYFSKVFEKRFGKRPGEYR